jgi:hypothetical protein
MTMSSLSIIPRLIIFLKTNGVGVDHIIEVCKTLTFLYKAAIFNLCTCLGWRARNVGEIDQFCTMCWVASPHRLPRTGKFIHKSLNNQNIWRCPYRKHLISTLYCELSQRPCISVAFRSALSLSMLSRVLTHKPDVLIRWIGSRICSVLCVQTPRRLDLSWTRSLTLRRPSKLTRISSRKLMLAR